MTKKQEIINQLESFCEADEIHIECSCGAHLVGYWEGELAEKAYNKGWRLDKDNFPVCPKCIMPKPKKKYQPFAQKNQALPLKKKK